MPVVSFAQRRSTPGKNPALAGEANNTNFTAIHPLEMFHSGTSIAEDSTMNRVVADRFCVNASA